MGWWYDNYIVLFFFFSECLNVSYSMHIEILERHFLHICILYLYSTLFFFNFFFIFNHFCFFQGCRLDRARGPPEDNEKNIQPSVAGCMNSTLQ